VEGQEGQTVVLEVDAVIAGRRMLAHPFYQRWLAGELTRDDLRRYAAQYFRFEAAFPGYLCQVLAKLDTAADRRVLLQNLVDEEGGPQTHLELFVRFANALGLTRDELEATPVTESTQALLETFDQATRHGSAAEGLVALYAYESQAAEVAASKTASLMASYSIAPGDGTAFWEVHAEADELHGAWERELLERLQPEPDRVVSACRKAADALWGFLDGFSSPAPARPVALPTPA
jgi:pyrroloquinoline-quinone synthase